MKRLLRPLVVTIVVSFTLGIWYSLAKSEKSLLTALKDRPLITIAARDPAPWEAIIPLVREQLGMDLRVIHSANIRHLEDLLKSDGDSCDLVALHSLYARHFIELNLLAKLENSRLKSLSLMGADFRAPTFDPSGSYFIPYLWTVGTWFVKSPEVASKIKELTDLITAPGLKGKAELATSREDLLLVAFDLGLTNNDSESAPEADGEMNIRPAFDRLKEQFAIHAPGESAIDTPPVRRDYATRESAMNPLPVGSNDDLQLIGLAPCRHIRHTETAHQFLDWLLEGSATVALLKTSGWGSTLTSSEHLEIDAAKKAMSIRDRELARLQLRELPWALVSSWDELLSLAGQ